MPPPFDAFLYRSKDNTFSIWTSSDYIHLDSNVVDKNMPKPVARLHSFFVHRLSVKNFWKTDSCIYRNNPSNNKRVLQNKQQKLSSQYELSFKDKNDLEPLTL